MRNHLITRRAYGRVVVVASILSLALPAAAGDFEGSPIERRSKIMEKYDKNDDGKLSDAELKTLREARRAENMAKHDTNRDGELSAPERQKATEARRLERWDRDNNGKIDAAEKATAQQQRRRENQQVLKRYDANKDGRLGDAERAKARSDGVMMDSGRKRR